MKYADRVKDTTTTTGTGTVTLAGSAPTGMRTFAAAFSAGQDNIPYLIDDGAGSWEIGIGKLATSSTLERKAVLSSSTGAKINFGAGTKTVTCTLEASTFQSVSVDPDDVGFDIVLLSGQSNMRGNGALDALLDVVDSRVWQWGCKSSDSARYQKITQALDPLSFNDTNAGLTGPGTWFARAYASTIPANRHVLLIPAAVGATSLVYGSAYWAVGNALYTEAIAQANAAIAAAVALYPKSRFVGVCWMQGEADGTDGSVSGAAYKTAFSNMLSGFRSGITGASNSWCVIGGMVPEFTAVSSSRQAIDTAHQQLASEIAKVVYVAGPSGNTSDDIHYTAPGARIIGSRMGLSPRSAIYEMDAAFAATAPGAPIIGTATAGNASASVTFSPPSSNGGAAITGYTVTSSPGGFTGTGSASPISVSGLTNGTAYTFTATAANSVGTGPASSASNSVTPAVGATVPGQVTGLTLGTATSTTQPLTWTAPSNGGSAITDYVVQWSPAGANTWTTFADGTSTTAAATVTGLGASTSYDYRVAAVNAIGTGSYSSTATGSTAANGATTTLNPSDKHADITLSGGNLTWTRSATTGGSWVSAKATTSRTTGKYKFEITVGAIGVWAGIGNAAASINTFPGGNGESIGLRCEAVSIWKSSGSIYNGSGSVAVGHVVSVLIDLDARTITFKDNNVVVGSSGLDISGITGAIFPMVGVSALSDTGSVNFGQSAFTYTDAGYAAWG